jgi:dephospho-CoA kinase
MLQIYRFVRRIQSTLKQCWLLLQCRRQRWLDARFPSRYRRSMLTIGLTGGVASGKSSVADLLARRGALVLDADRVAHETYNPGSPGFASVVSVFGPDIVGPDGAIDRRVLGRIVFADTAALKRLTDIVWPLTGELLARRRSEALDRGVTAVVIDAAVLREAGWSALCDEVWLVRVPAALARRRLMERNGLSAAEADARLQAQAAVLRSDDGVDVVIDNAGNLDDLETQVELLWRAVLERTR